MHSDACRLHLIACIKTLLRGCHFRTHQLIWTTIYNWNFFTNISFTCLPVKTALSHRWIGRSHLFSMDVFFETTLFARNLSCVELQQCRHLFIRVKWRAFATNKRRKSITHYFLFVQKDNSRVLAVPRRISARCFSRCMQWRAKWISGNMCRYLRRTSPICISNSICLPSQMKRSLEMCHEAQLTVSYPNNWMTIKS